jgi:nicotinamide riboside transporter PnuC
MLLKVFLTLKNPKNSLFWVKKTQKNKKKTKKTPKKTKKNHWAVFF